jgi:curved DNA-binding protein CbpA
MKNFIFEFAILCIMAIVYCKKDYYKILELDRNANPQQIKKNFKKLSLKYHPDKNKKNPEVAKQKFIEVANAYEVLSDPEKKKIYDLHGEEGVNDHTARENAGQGGGGFQNFGMNMGGSFEDIFNQFFSGGGGGQRQFRQGGGGFHYQQQGGRRQHMHQQEEEEKNYFENTDVINLKMNNLSKLYGRSQIWFVLFFKANDKEFESMREMWKTLAEKSYGIFKIAAVNCKFDEEICEEFNIRSSPLIVYFPESSDNEEVYRGIKKWEEIFKFGAVKMQSFVRSINSGNYGDFITSNPTQHKVILFTSRKSTPPLLKALSKHFKGKLSFGEVRPSEKELVDKFGVKNFPTVMVLSEPEGYKGITYDGTLNRDSLEKFLNQFAYQAIKVEKTASVSEFTNDIYNKQKICNENDGKNICVLYIYNGDHLSAEDNILLENVAKKYLNDPIKLFYINPSKYNHFWVSFDKEDTNARIIVLRGKRKRYAALCKDKTDSQEIYNGIDNILSGGGSFKKLIKKLNIFSVVQNKEDL